MICYVLAMGKQHLGPHVVVGYDIKMFWPGLFITSPDHLAWLDILGDSTVLVMVAPKKRYGEAGQKRSEKQNKTNKTFKINQ